MEAQTLPGPLALEGRPHRLLPAFVSASDALRRPLVAVSPPIEAAAASVQPSLPTAAAAATAASSAVFRRTRQLVRGTATGALGPQLGDEEAAADDLLLLQGGQEEAAAGSSKGRRRTSSGEELYEGDPEEEEEAMAEGLLPSLPTAAAAAAAAAEEDAESASGDVDESMAASETASGGALSEPSAATTATAAGAAAGGRPEWLAAPLSASKAAQKAALRALRRKREASSSPTWRSFLNRLPPEEDEAQRNAREGLPPPHAKTVEQLPVKTLNIGGETIPYRQALESTPMFVDLETFERLKAQWADNPEELKRLQKATAKRKTAAGGRRVCAPSEDKAEYGIAEAVPDEDWVPVRRDLPKGRLVISHGLIPVNTTTAEAGYDYVETYFDPKRNYEWSYKRYNPYKQAGDGSEEEEETEGVEPYYRLGSEEARRYYLKETNPPQRETDDGIFRQATLAEEMISGIRRSPEGEEAWDFIPDAPFGQLAPQQNFNRSLSVKDLPWVREVIAQRLKRQKGETLEAPPQTSEPGTAAAAGAAPAGQAAGGPAANATATGEAAAAAEGAAAATPAATASSLPRYGPLIGEPGEVLPLPPPLPQPGDSRPLRMTVEEVFHRQHRHVALPVSTGCAEPKLFLPGRGDRLPPLPIPLRPAPWPLTYRQLGSSELYVSEVGLGTMFMGGPQGPPAGEGNYNNPADLLSYAVDGWGVNFIDTAELYPLPASPQSYGVAEGIVGEWIRRRGAAKRAEVVLATKVAGPHPRLSWLRNEPAKGLRGTCLSKAQILAAAEGSLKRLGVSYIDLLQLHWPQRYVPSHDTGDAADVLFDIPIRAWGLSNETPYGLLRFCQLAKARGLPPPASCQVHYNLLFRNDVEKQFVEAVRPQNTGVSLIAYGALAGGLLTGKYLEWLEYPTAGRLLRFPSYMQRLRGSMAAKAVREYFNLARKFEQPNLTTVSLKWVFSRPFIASTLLGFSDYYQLRENLHCLHPAAGAMTDWMEREINFIHWKCEETPSSSKQQQAAAKSNTPQQAAASDGKQQQAGLRITQQQQARVLPLTPGFAAAASIAAPNPAAQSAAAANTAFVAAPGGLSQRPQQEIQRRRPPAKHTKPTRVRAAAAAKAAVCAHYNGVIAAAAFELKLLPLRAVECECLLTSTEAVSSAAKRPAAILRRHTLPAAAATDSAAATAKAAATTAAAPAPAATIQQQRQAPREPQLCWAQKNVCGMRQPSSTRKDRASSSSSSSSREAVRAGANAKGALPPKSLDSGDGPRASQQSPGRRFLQQHKHRSTSVFKKQQNTTFSEATNAAAAARAAALGSFIGLHLLTRKKCRESTMWKEEKYKE
ncbi:hypothetical protein Emed_000054 [Eimeria media]